MSASNRNGVGPSVMDWVGRHPRTLSWLVLLAVAGIVYRIEWHNVSADWIGWYKVLPLVAVVALAVAATKYPEFSPHIEFFGSHDKGREALLMLNLPGVKRDNERIDRATELRRSGGRTRLRWPTGVVGLTEQTIDTSAVGMYRHYHAVTHTLTHKPRRYWELTFYRTQPRDPLARPVDLAPEDWS